MGSHLFKIYLKPLQKQKTLVRKTYLQQQLEGKSTQTERKTTTFCTFASMYFDDYINFPTAKLNPRLLWEYTLSNLDYTSMRNIIVQRVIERGWPEDWYFMLNHYGIDGVKSAIKELPYLNDKDMNFVSHQFEIPLTALKCYEKKRSATSHWTS